MEVVVEGVSTTFSQYPVPGVRSVGGTVLVVGLIRWMDRRGGGLGRYVSLRIRTRLLWCFGLFASIGAA